MGGSNVPDCFTSDPARLFPEFRDLFPGERIHAAFRENSGAPEDFVSHPVADAWKGFLHQQRSFHWDFATAREKILDQRTLEPGFVRLGGKIAPPSWRLFANVKLNASELARIVEHEGTLFLKKNEVIVFGWREVSGFDEKFAGHAEMHTQPAIA